MPVEWINFLMLIFSETLATWLVELAEALGAIFQRGG
jgi:hypothetical protein